MKKITGVFMLSFLLSACQSTAEEGKYRGYELPKYKIFVKDKNIELREYEPQLVAEVSVDGDRDAAANKGFRILAAYIFGDNESKNKVAMTTPVTQEKWEAKSENIAMTTPVTQEKKGEEWIIRFGMPKEYTLETLPKAKDDRIHFHTTKPSKKAAIIFSGLMNDEKITKQTVELEKFVTDRKLEPIGKPYIAYYDDPFTFPWNRRNEVLWDIK